MKTCSTCRGIKDTTQFARNVATPDGFQNQCRDCDKEYRLSARGRAVRAWHHINERAGNANGLSPSYVNVENRMTRKTFLEWAEPAFQEAINKYPEGAWLTVDRINEGHYELGNLQIITHSENSSKKVVVNTNAPADHQWCNNCKGFKHLSKFSKGDNLRGRASFCQECNGIKHRQKVEARGGKVRYTKATDRELEEIRNAPNCYGIISQLSRKHGRSRGTISKIRNGIL